jgi:hypothetical protein
MPGLGYATPVVYNFKGTVTEINGAEGLNIYGTPNLKLGTAFSATFIWDKENISKPFPDSDPDLHTCPVPEFSFSVEGFDDFSLSSPVDFNSPDDTINELMFYVSMRSENPQIRYSVIDNIINSSLFGLNGSIRDGFLVDDFIGAKYFTQIVEGNFDYFSGPTGPDDAWYSAIFTIEEASIKPVPEPSTVLLLIIGLLSQACFWLKNKKRKTT